MQVESGRYRCHDSTVQLHRSTLGTEIAMNEVQTLTKAALRLRLDATAECLLVVRQAIEGAAKAQNIDGQLLDDLKLAATEACSNVVKYAYPESAGKLWVEFDADSREARLAVCDSGTWREPSPSGNIEQSGMGLPLIEAITSKCEIDHDESGTRVVMTFERTAQSPADVPTDDD